MLDLLIKTGKIFFELADARTGAVIVIVILFGGIMLGAVASLFFVPAWIYRWLEDKNFKSDWKLNWAAIGSIILASVIINLIFILIFLLLGLLLN